MLMSVNAQSRPPVARRYRRYIVSGSVVFQGPGGESRGALLNVGQGGLLVRTDSLYRGGLDLSLLFQIVGYSETVATLGRILGTKEKPVGDPIPRGTGGDRCPAARAGTRELRRGGRRSGGSISVPPVAIQPKNRG